MTGPFARRDLRLRLLRRLAWVVVFFGIGFFSTAARAQLLSPGPLSQAHSSLEGDEHCSDCHSAGKRVGSDLCTNKCHSDLGARIAAGAGLHGREYKGQPCEKCHGEHHGTNLRIVRWPGGTQQAFEHAQAGWPLQNAHKGVACEKCHTRTNARGAKTFLGLAQTCTPCHKDPHTGRFGNACTSCHDDVKWGNLKLDGFDHGKARYPLKGAHIKTPCAKCHAGQPPKYAPLAFGNCTDCHKDAHNGKFGTACTTCHVEDAWAKVSITNASHPGVSLANGHAPVACATCHDKGNKAPPSKGSTCSSCHQTSHKAPFGANCATCHGTIKWMGLARNIGLSAHGRTAYPLSGKHLDTNCASCHKPQLPRNARYRQLKFGRCADCHEDTHKGEFASAKQGECAPCHATSGFRPTLFGTSAHSQTKFALDGAHLSVACVGCHTEPRPRVSLHVSKQACADCHQNPHGDQFAVEMKAGGCAQCHITASWARAKFDHATWPLTGVHATAQCESCHHPTPEDKKQGKGASYRGLPRTCGGCHDDIHVAQFRSKAPVYECDKCHSTKAFKIPSFDHAAIAGYPLTGDHAKVTCDKCHLSEKLVNGKAAIRYRLPSKECADCHKNPHSAAAR